MRHSLPFIAQTLAAAALLCVATASAGQATSGAEATVEIDDAPTGEQMAADLIVMRPLGLAGTLIGTAIFIVALPINALTLNFKDPARRLILEPARFTFVRPLGDLD
jgi:hypothetical protein